MVTRRIDLCDGFRATCHFALAWGLLAAAVLAQDPLPRLLDPRLELQLVAEHPALVTPTGLTWDEHGRLLVVESHTHFRPEDYQGPPSDRIRLLADANGDGNIEVQGTFYEGTEATMDILAGPEGWIYVATRAEVFRLRDDDRDGRADRREDLVRLETRGDYPHNGLSGLAFDDQQTLYFGFGENLGESYELVGRDGRCLNGGGEGGNVFRCTRDGEQLQRVATGFWNPFGLCFDPAGRLFAVDNDPDASPPCRLLHVVPGADFGYQFRYGRSGRHPLQAWDGQLPGTLPMLAGTGEAPCAVLAWGGCLWVSSWGDNRIERYRLEPAGATLSAQREVVVQGDARFRPVDFALGPDGALYFTDWVDVSYPLHGAGRLWRIDWREPSTELGEWPMRSQDEQQAASLRSTFDWDALDHPDAYLRQAAIWNLAQRDDLDEIDPFQRPTARQRLGVLEAMRWRSRDMNLPPDRVRSHLATALQQDDAAVRLFAIRWIADAGLKELIPQVEAQWSREDVDARYVLAVLAALDWLQGGTVEENRVERDGRLLQLAGDGRRPSSVRIAALQALSGEFDQAAVAALAELIESGPPLVQREAARSLALAAAPQARAKCAELVQRPDLPARLRADLVLALEGDPSARSLLEQRAHDPVPVGTEARRALEGPPASDREEGVELPAENTERWLAILGQGQGDADAGWRLFFSANGPRCGNCHSIQGRSRESSGRGTVGPDLTEVGKRLDTGRLLESILQPSREVAPQFVPWVIEMEDGRIFTGLSLGRFDGEKYERFVGADGGTFVLQTSQVARRDASDASIMPSGLQHTLSTEQLRDLLAFLTQGTFASDL